MQLFINYFIYVAITFIATSLGTQMLKIFFRAVTVKKFRFKNNLTQDGGFPSSHTAFSASWTVIAIFFTIHLFLKHANEDLLLFALVLSTIAVGNMCIVIRDALGVRRTVQILCDSVKASALSSNELIKSRNFDNETTVKIQKNFEDIAKKMNRKSGHLPHEVIGGATWGVLISGAISSFYYGYYALMICFIIAIAIYVISISIFIKYSSKILNFITSTYKKFLNKINYV